MITAIAKTITNPTLVDIAQNTNAQVACETTLKAIGRPGFILIDNDIDSSTKKYAAAKEFLYQATCLPYLKRVRLILLKNIFIKVKTALTNSKAQKNTLPTTKWRKNRLKTGRHRFQKIIQCSSLTMTA